MEAHVGLVEGLVVVAPGTVDRRCHVVEGGFEDRDRLSIGALGRERRRVRLDHRPHFRQLAQERGARCLVVLPRHHVRIEQVPGLARRHPRPDLRLRFDQPLRRQDLDRLAERGSAGGHRRAGLQRIAGTDLAAQNAPAERVHDLAVQVAMRVAERNRGHAEVRV